MMIKAIAFTALVVAAAAVPISDVSEKFTGMSAAFDAWKVQHGKAYATPEEHMRRLDIFKQNAITVEEHNAKGLSWYMALNQFADLTAEEFVGLNRLMESTLGTDSSPAADRHVANPNVTLPSAVDWRSKNAVNAVKNQGQCGSCWAFSTVVSYEGQVALKTGKLTSFSEQNLVDCVKDVTVDGGACCDGCKGGLMDSAFEYMMASQSGLDDTESAYPYKGTDGTCAFAKGSAGSTPVKKYTDIAKGDETSLKSAAATVGPISVAVDANMFWQLYGGGVFQPLFCNPDKLDHGVAVVGYGSENGKDYWIIRNSWGATWGESGYMRLVMGKNECGVANSAVYPVV